MLASYGLVVQTLNAFLPLLLVFAMFFYFAGFIVPAPLKWRLWRWAVGLVALVFIIALVVVEVRAHPAAAFFVASLISTVSYAILQARRAHRDRAHRRPAPTPFLNLRVTGKTAVDLDDEHPFADDGEERE